MSSSPVPPIEVDAAVFIALQEEFKWFREIFDGPMEVIRHESHFFYRLQHNAAQEGPYKLVVVLGDAMGGMAAALTTSHLLQRFKVRTMVNIGIAGGLKDVHLGDVVIPSQVNAFFENSKAVAAPNDSFRFE